MATYYTRIHIKVDKKELIDKLCALDISDIGKGYYKAEEIFNTSSMERSYFDGESAINENDLEELVKRVVNVIKGQGTILADTYSYDYDPLPQVCYYNGYEIISKQLLIDGGDFVAMTDISDISSWIQFVESSNEYIRNLKEVTSCKVKFESGSYWYKGEVQLNDIVRVEGAKAGFIGKVIELGTTYEDAALYNIIEVIGNVGALDSNYFETWWNSNKPKERKEHLKNLGIDENTTKKKFLSIIEFKWINFVLRNGNDPNEFVNTLGLQISIPS